MTSVWLHSSIALAAMRAKRDREYRVWLLARALDKCGCGRVSLADLASFAHKWAGLNAWSFRKTVQRGQGAFWRVHEGALYYLAPGALAEALDCELPRRKVAVSIGELAKLGTFRAVIVKAWIGERGTRGRMVSVRTVGALAGKGRATAGRYLRGVTRLGNLCESHELTVDAMLDHAPGKVGNTARAHGWRVITANVTDVSKATLKPSRQTFVGRALPSRYIIHDLPTKSLHRRGCGQDGRHAAGSCGQEGRGGTSASVRYCLTDRAAVRALHKMQPLGKVYNPTRRWAGGPAEYGAQLWQGCWRGLAGEVYAL